MMKLKHLLQTFAVVLLCGCTAGIADVDEVNTSGNDVESTTLPSTSVTMYTNSKPNQIAFAPAQASPHSQAYFYIRLDGKMIDITDGVAQYPESEYGPVTADGQSILNTHNRSKVSNKSSNYVQATDVQKDPDGDGVELIEYFISDNLDEVKTRFSGNPSVTIESLAKCDGNVAPLKKFKEEQEALGKTVGIQWYAIKHFTDGWRVEGVATVDGVPAAIKPDPVPPVPPTVLPGEVEVDIHQQIHNTWNEIKTAIHIREVVNTRVTIPIGKNDLAEADDFAIRTYNGYYTIDNTTYPLTVNVTHGDDAIVIEVEGVTQEMLDALKASSDDGITVEVNSYYQNISHAEAWAKMKLATVETYDDQCTIKGQITSAMYPEVIPIE